MYKFLEKKQIKNIKKIENQFVYLSKKFSNKEKFNWWYHNSSRLDFRPWGGLPSGNFFDIPLKKLIFFKLLLRDLLLILRALFCNLFIKKISINLRKNIFIEEKVTLNKEDKYSIIYTLLSVDNNLFFIVLHSFIVIDDRAI